MLDLLNITDILAWYSTYFCVYYVIQIVVVQQVAVTHHKLYSKT